MIRVQKEDFDVGAEMERLARGNPRVGGVAVFVGLVRDMAEGAAVHAMTLEHYPGMTERELAKIEAEANRRWPLEASLIIHRHGALAPGDRIVMVAAASAHRDAAFAACRFLIDWLKTKAPFWKLEDKGGDAQWVAAREDDAAAATAWEGAKPGPDRRKAPPDRRKAPSDRRKSSPNRRKAPSDRRKNS